jgi:hypothetical protein
MLARMTETHAATRPNLTPRALQASADAVFRPTRDPRLQRILVALAALVKGSTFLFALDPLLRPKHPKFQGKAMRIRVVGYFGVLAAIPLAWIARGRKEPYPAAQDLMLSVPLLLDAGGNSMGLYDKAHIDDAVHFANGAILMSAFGAAISPHVPTRVEAAALTVGFGAVGSLAWEVMEYAGEKLGFKGMNLTYEDTIEDTIESFAGSLIAAGVTYARWRPQAGSDPA